MKLWLMVLVLLMVCSALFELRGRFRWSDQTFVPAIAGCFSLYWALVCTLIVRYQYRSHLLRDDRSGPGSASPRIMIAAGPTMGILAWMIHLAIGAGDSLSAIIVTVAIIAISAWGVYGFGRRPRNVMLAYTLLFGGVIVLMVNWRLDAWVAALDRLTHRQSTCRCGA